MNTLASLLFALVKLIFWKGSALFYIQSTFCIARVIYTYTRRYIPLKSGEGMKYWLSCLSPLSAGRSHGESIISKPHSSFFQWKVDLFIKIFYYDTLRPNTPKMPLYYTKVTQFRGKKSFTFMDEKVILLYDIWIGRTLLLTELQERERKFTTFPFPKEERQKFKAF